MVNPCVSFFAQLLFATSVVLLIAACSSQATSERGTTTSNDIIRQPHIVAALSDEMTLAECELQFTDVPSPVSWAKTPEEEASLYEWTLGSAYKAMPLLDPNTATLEQILDRSRVAMGDIVTYKSCSKSLDRDSPGAEFSTNFYDFTAFHSYDHYRSVMKNSVDSSAQFWESLKLGSTDFRRDTDHSWEESQPSPAAGMQPTPPSEGLAWILYEHDLELISNNETADNGEKVYRLAFTKMLPGFINEDEVQTARTTSVLISHETFRMVSYIQEDYPGFEWPTDWSKKVAYVDWWLSDVYTMHYFDYNVPVVLESPEDYVPYEETVMTR